ncbi:MAG: 50S ribosomal protein L13 [Candidatus Makana argininalis]
MKNLYTNKKLIIKKWYIVDAKNKILGRLATKLSIILSGKNKPEYTPNIDNGDYIIIINSKKIKVTGNKFEKKIYYKHSGYIGGLKKTSYKDKLLKNPNFIIKNAVKGMLPKGPLGRNMLKKLKIYNNKKHNHQSQKPEILLI